MEFLKSNADKYYKMSDAELESEASKWKIRSYGNTNGVIERSIIISELLRKDQANGARLALLVSAVSLIISIVALAF